MELLNNFNIEYFTTLFLLKFACVSPHTLNFKVELIDKKLYLQALSAFSVLIVLLYNIIKS